MINRHEDGQQMNGESGSSIRSWARKLDTSNDPLSAVRKAEEEERQQAQRRAQEEEQERLQAQEEEEVRFRVQQEQQARLRAEEGNKPDAVLKKSSRLCSKLRKSSKCGAGMRNSSLLIGVLKKSNRHAAGLRKSSLLGAGLSRNSRPEDMLKKSNRLQSSASAVESLYMLCRRSVHLLCTIKPSRKTKDKASLKHFHCIDCMLAEARTGGACALTAVQDLTSVSHHYQVLVQCLPVSIRCV